MYIHVTYWCDTYIRIYEKIFKVPEDISWCIDWDTFDELFKQEAKKRGYNKITYKLSTHPDL